MAVVVRIEEKFFSFVKVFFFLLPHHFISFVIVFDIFFRPPHGHVEKVCILKEWRGRHSKYDQWWYPSISHRMN